MTLRLDWCSYKDTKRAVEKWHYSHNMPPSKAVRVGVWENDLFVGVIVFNCGSGHATDDRRYGLKACGEMVELARVALRKHQTPVTRIIAIALKMLKKANPGVTTRRVEGLRSRRSTSTSWVSTLRCVLA